MALGLFHTASGYTCYIVHGSFQYFYTVERSIVTVTESASLEYTYKSSYESSEPYVCVHTSI